MIVLITGGSGFVGSSIAILLKLHYPHYRIICFDNLRRRGSELNLNRLTEAGIEFLHGDIRSIEDLKVVGPINILIEASAEPSVLAGINSTADYTIQTNLLGTINALNFAKFYNASFIFLSTSRIYPINQIEKIRTTEQKTRFVLNEIQELTGISKHGISEQFPLDGYRSIYGATKLASELMIQEFHHFYGMKTIVNRCGVLTGPWQMGKVDQGVIVLWMARHYWNSRLSYVGFGGTGKQVRDILHVRDLYDLIDQQIQHQELFNGDIFNVGGGLANTVSLQELTLLCQEISGNSIPIDEEKENRKADIRLFITDNTKITERCGWTPKVDTKTMLQEIHNWLSTHHKILESVLK